MLTSRGGVLLSVVAVMFAAPAAGRAQGPFNKQHVTYNNAGLTLAAYVYKPPGAGPFPTVVWNHGSEKNPGGMRQFDSVAAIFVPAGCVGRAPRRGGPGDWQGSGIVDSKDAVRPRRGPAEAAKEAVHLLETEQVSD